MALATAPKKRIVPFIFYDTVLACPRCGKRQVDYRVNNLGHGLEVACCDCYEAAARRGDPACVLVLITPDHPSYELFARPFKR